MDERVNYSLGAALGVKRGTGSVRDAAGLSSEAVYMLEVQRDERGIHAVSGLLLTVSEPAKLAFDGPLWLRLATGAEMEITLSPVDGFAGPPFVIHVAHVPPGLFPHL